MASSDVLYTELYLYLQTELWKYYQEDILVSNDDINLQAQKIIRKAMKIFNLKETPSKAILYKVYKRLIETKTIKPNGLMESVLTLNSVRSQSGVLPISVALNGNVSSCQYNCSFCPNETIANSANVNIARSYLSSEGTFIRGGLEGFDICRQIWRRLAELETMGHPPDKLEFIALGGTFDCFPREYRLFYSLSVFYACNIYSELSIRFNGKFKEITEEWLSLNPFLNGIGLNSETVKKIQKIRPMPDLSGKNVYESYRIISIEQEINSKLNCCRVIGMVLETRPDRISKYTMLEMRALGCTRVQLGIQSTSDDVLTFNNRGHGVKESITANKMLRDNCFKVDGHIMPDLPGTTIEIDYQTVKDIFLNDHLQLDYCKIYPCLDLPFTQIREWKNDGTWVPISENNFREFLDFLIYTLTIVPPWTRINRVHRDFPVASAKNNYLGYVSDTIKPNLQQIITTEMHKRSLACYDIRTREIGLAGVIRENVKLYIRTYRANEGTEFFISLEMKNNSSIHFDDTVLLGLCRLRIVDTEDVAHLLPTFKQYKGNVARVRELHVYGNIAFDSKDSKDSKDSQDSKAQHKGIGKFLMSVAENISRTFNCSYITVISGVGVRGYYEALNYKLEEKTDAFMTKSLIDTACQAPLSVLNNTYDYDYIENVILKSKIVSKFFKDEFKKSKPVKVSLNDWHPYNDIQNGDAEGFSFSHVNGYSKLNKHLKYTVLLFFAIVFIVILFLLKHQIS